MFLHLASFYLAVGWTAESPPAILPVVYISWHIVMSYVMVALGF